MNPAGFASEIARVTMMEIGVPIKRWEVIPLTEPVRETPEPREAPVPEHAPEKEREPA